MLVLGVVLMRFVGKRDRGRGKASGGGLGEERMELGFLGRSRTRDLWEGKGEEEVVT
jgi:hypothetical protein